MGMVAAAVAVVAVAAAAAAAAAAAVFSAVRINSDGLLELRGGAFAFAMPVRGGVLSFFGDSHGSFP